MSLDGAHLNFVNAAGVSVSQPATGRKFIVGSYINSDLVLPKAERLHCEIQCDAFGRVTILNHSRTEPVTLNGQLVSVKRPLLHGAQLQILDEVYTWNFPKTSECEHVTGTEATTPERQPNAQPEQPPNSCPGLKTHRWQNIQRMTVHNFRYSINSDDENNQSSESCDQLEVSSTTSEVVAESPRCITPPNPEDSHHDDVVVESPKIDVLESTQNKENATTPSNKKLLQFCALSDVVITSFSPRQTGVTIEKSFTRIVKPQMTSQSTHNTPKSTYSTPKSVLSELNDDSCSHDPMDFATPSTSKNASTSRVNSSMFLIDLTTPQKLRPTLGTPASKQTPSNNTPSSTSSSVISVDSTDESGTSSPVAINLISSATPPPTTSMLRKTPKQQFRAIASTPKRTPQSLMKRALLTSAKKQIASPMRTTTTATPKIAAVRQSLFDARRQSLSTPRRKIPFNKSTTTTNTTCDSTPPPLKIVPQTNKQTPRTLPRISKSNQNAFTCSPRDNKLSLMRKSLAVTRRTPQSALTNKLLARARRSLNSRKDDGDGETVLSFVENKSSTPERNQTAELSRTFTIDNEDDKNESAALSTTQTLEVDNDEYETKALLEKMEEIIRRESGLKSSLKESNQDNSESIKNPSYSTNVTQVIGEMDLNNTQGVASSKQVEIISPTGEHNSSSVSQNIGKEDDEQIKVDNANKSELENSIHDEEKIEGVAVGKDSDLREPEISIQSEEKNTEANTLIHHEEKNESSIQHEEKNESYIQNEEKNESSIQHEEKNESSIQHEEKNESSIQHEEKNESYIQNEDKNESYIQHEEKNESSIQHEEKNESYIQHEEKNESSIHHEEKNESSSQHEEKNESSIQHEENTESSIQHEENNESSIQHEEKNESSIQHGEKNEDVNASKSSIQHEDKVESAVILTVSGSTVSEIPNLHEENIENVTEVEGTRNEESKSLYVDESKIDNISIIKDSVNMESEFSIQEKAEIEDKTNSEIAIEEKIDNVTDVFDSEIKESDSKIQNVSTVKDTDKEQSESSIAVEGKIEEVSNVADIQQKDLEKEEKIDDVAVAKERDNGDSNNSTLKNLFADETKLEANQKDLANIETAANNGNFSLQQIESSVELETPAEMGVEVETNIEINKLEQKSSCENELTKDVTSENVKSADVQKTRRNSRRLSSDQSISFTPRRSARRASMEANSNPQPIVATPKRKRSFSTDEMKTPTRQSRRLAKTPQSKMLDNAVDDMGIIVEEETAAAARNSLAESPDEDYGSEIPTTTTTTSECPQSPDTVDYKGMREMLKTPKGCSTPLFKGLRDMMRTPKVHVLATLTERSHQSPSLLNEGEGLDKFFKTPRAKNIMIPNEPASGVLQSRLNNDSIPPTEYDLNVTNASLPLDKIFDDMPLEGNDTEVEISVNAISVHDDPLAAAASVKKSHSKYVESVEPEDSVASQALVDISIAGTSLKDPLTSTAYKPANDKFYKFRSVSPTNVGEMSGIQLLDQSVDSVFTESLRMHETECEITVDETRRTAKSNVEAEDTLEESMGLGEPLIVSDDESDEDLQQNLESNSSIANVTTTNESQMQADESVPPTESQLEEQTVSFGESILEQTVNDDEDQNISVAEKTMHSINAEQKTFIEKSIESSCEKKWESVSHIDENKLEISTISVNQDSVDDSNVVNTDLINETNPTTAEELLKTENSMKNKNEQIDVTLNESKTGDGNEISSSLLAADNSNVIAVDCEIKSDSNPCTSKEDIAIEKLEKSIAIVEDSIHSKSITEDSIQSKSICELTTDDINSTKEDSVLLEQQPVVVDEISAVEEREPDVNTTTVLIEENTTNTSPEVIDKQLNDSISEPINQQEKIQEEATATIALSESNVTSLDLTTPLDAAVDESIELIEEEIISKNNSDEKEILSEQTKESELEAKSNADKLETKSDLEESNANDTIDLCEDESEISVNESNTVNSSEQVIVENQLTEKLNQEENSSSIECEAVDQNGLTKDDLKKEITVSPDQTQDESDEIATSESLNINEENKEDQSLMAENLDETQTKDETQTIIKEVDQSENENLEATKSTDSKAIDEPDNSQQNNEGFDEIESNEIKSTDSGNNTELNKDQSDDEKITPTDLAQSTGSNDGHKSCNVNNEASANLSIDLLSDDETTEPQIIESTASSSDVKLNEDQVESEKTVAKGGTNKEEESDEVIPVADTPIDLLSNAEVEPQETETSEVDVSEKLSESQSDREKKIVTEDDSNKVEASDESIPVVDLPIDLLSDEETTEPLATESTAVDVSEKPNKNQADIEEITTTDPSTHLTMNAEIEVRTEALNKEHTVVNAITETSEGEYSEKINEYQADTEKRIVIGGDNGKEQTNDSPIELLSDEEVSEPPVTESLGVDASEKRNDSQAESKEVTTTDPSKVAEIEAQTKELNKEQSVLTEISESHSYEKLNQDQADSEKRTVTEGGSGKEQTRESPIDLLSDDETTEPLVTESTEVNVSEKLNESQADTEERTTTDNSMISQIEAQVNETPEGDANKLEASDKPISVADSPIDLLSDDETAEPLVTESNDNKIIDKSLNRDQTDVLCSSATKEAPTNDNVKPNENEEEASKSKDSCTNSELIVEKENAASVIEVKEVVAITPGIKTNDVKVGENTLEVKAVDVSLPEGSSLNVNVAETKSEFPSSDVIDKSVTMEDLNIGKTSIDLYESKNTALDSKLKAPKEEESTKNLDLDSKLKAPEEEESTDVSKQTPTTEGPIDTKPMNKEEMQTSSKKDSKEASAKIESEKSEKESQGVQIEKDIGNKRKQRTRKASKDVEIIQQNLKEKIESEKSIDTIEQPKRRGRKASADPIDPPDNTKLKKRTRKASEDVEDVVHLPESVETKPKKRGRKASKDIENQGEMEPSGSGVENTLEIPNVPIESTDNEKEENKGHKELEDIAEEDQHNNDNAIAVESKRRVRKASQTIETKRTKQRTGSSSEDSNKKAEPMPPIEESTDVNTDHMESHDEVVKSKRRRTISTNVDGDVAASKSKEAPKRRGRKPSEDPIEKPIPKTLEVGSKVEQVNTQSKSIESSEDIAEVKDTKKEDEPPTAEIPAKNEVSEEKKDAVTESPELPKRRGKRAAAEVAIETPVELKPKRRGRNQPQEISEKVEPEIEPSSSSIETVEEKPKRRGRKPSKDEATAKAKTEDVLQPSSTETEVVEPITSSSRNVPEELPKRRGRKPSKDQPAPAQETQSQTQEELQPSSVKVLEELPKRRGRKGSASSVDDDHEEKPKRRARNISESTTEKVEKVEHLTTINEIEEPPRPRNSRSLTTEPAPPPTTESIEEKSARKSSENLKVNKEIIEPTISKPVRTRRGREPSPQVKDAAVEVLVKRSKRNATHNEEDNKQQQPADEIESGAPIQTPSVPVEVKQPTRRARKLTPSVEVVELPKRVVRRGRKKSIGLEAESIPEKALDQEVIVHAIVEAQPTPEIVKPLIISPSIKNAKSDAHLSPSISTEDELTPRRREGRNIPRKNYDETSDEDKIRSVTGRSRKPVGKAAAQPAVAKQTEAQQEPTVEPSITVEPQIPVTNSEQQEEFTASPRREGRNLPRRNYQEFFDEEKPTSSRSRRIRHPTVKALETIVDSASRPSTPKQQANKTKVIIEQSTPVAADKPTKENKRGRNVLRSATVEPESSSDAGVQETGKHANAEIVEEEKQQTTTTTTKRPARGNSRKTKQTESSDVTHEQPVTKRARGKKQEVVVTPSKDDVLPSSEVDEVITKTKPIASRARGRAAAKIAAIEVIAPIAVIDEKPAAAAASSSSSSRGRRVHFDWPLTEDSASVENTVEPPKRTTRARRK